MEMERIGRVLQAMQDRGLAQMIVCDPQSIDYLTGVYVEPMERPVRPVPAGRRPPHFLFEQALHRARDPHRAGVVHRHRRRRGPHRPAGPGR